MAARREVPRYRFDHPSPTSFPFRVLRQTRLSRRKTVWNEHAYFEIAFVHEGRGFLKTLDRKRRFRKGSLVWTNVAEPHRWFPDEAAVVTFLQFHRPFLAGLEPFLSDAPRHPELSLARFLAGESRGCAVHPLPPARLFPMGDLIDSLHREMEQRGDAFDTAVRAGFLKLWVEVHRALVWEKAGARRAPPAAGEHVQWALDHIQAHFTEPLDLAELASRTPWSADYFSRLFKRLTSYHLSEYVNEVRVREACRLLDAGAASVSDVALRVGYRHIPYFNRTFKSITGFSPTGYRKSEPN
ncbi:MAG: helix-turn-helix transcriptional regulator [Spirochaetes bacterium]|nr:helix-turn-helix transcriptional regulator [Spirochaetota bacterium]